MKSPLITYIYYTRKKSGLGRGIRFNYDIRKYEAIIKIDRKTEYIGAFITHEEACLAYDYRALDIYGENAITNFKHDKGIYIKDIRRSLILKKKEKILNKIERKNKRILKKYFNYWKEDNKDEIEPKSKKSRIKTPDYWSVFKDLNDEDKINFIRFGILPN